MLVWDSPFLYSRGQSRRTMRGFLIILRVDGKYQHRFLLRKRSPGAHPRPPSKRIFEAYRKLASTSKDCQCTHLRILGWVISLFTITPLSTFESSISPPGIFSTRAYRLMSTVVCPSAVDETVRTAVKARLHIKSPHLYLSLALHKPKGKRWRKGSKR